MWYCFKFSDNTMEIHDITVQLQILIFLKNAFYQLKFEITKLY